MIAQEPDRPINRVSRRPKAFARCQVEGWECGACIAAWSDERPVVQCGFGPCLSDAMDGTACQLAETVCRPSGFAIQSARSTDEGTQIETRMQRNARAAMNELSWKCCQSCTAPPAGGQWHLDVPTPPPWRSGQRKDSCHQSKRFLPSRYGSGCGSLTRSLIQHRL